MKTRVLALLALFLTALCGMAQEVQEVKAQINDIKKKTSVYLYSEITAATEQEARDLAEELLYDEINKWAATKKKLQGSPSLLINNKKSCISTLTTPRGNMFRCFMYIKKSDIQKADNADLVDNPGARPAPNAPLGSKTPATPAAEAKKEAPLQSSVDEIPPPGSRPRYPQSVRTLASIRTYRDILAKAQELKQSGEIVELVTANFPENIEQFYLVGYDTDGRVQALLTPGMQRVNVCTGNDDTERNYHGCKAFAFKVK